jgi:hypothetical protein
LNKELSLTIAAAFLPAKRPPGEDVDEDFQGQAPEPETLAWEFDRYWKFHARHRARIARRLGVLNDGLDEL